MKSFYLKKQSGFTLIELLVVLAIIGILTSVGVPSYNKFVSDGQFNKAYGNLYNAYRFARAEAIKSSATLKVEANGGDWVDGWVVLPPSGGVGDIVLQTQQIAPHLTINVPSNVIFVTGRGAMSAAGTTQLSVVDTNNGNYTEYICILQNGQSYKSEAVCPA